MSIKEKNLSDGSGSLTEFLSSGTDETQPKISPRVQMTSLFLQSAPPSGSSHSSPRAFPKRKVSANTFGEKATELMKALRPTEEPKQKKTVDEPKSALIKKDIVKKSVHNQNINNPKIDSTSAGISLEDDSLGSIPQIKVVAEPQIGPNNLPQKRATAPIEFSAKPFTANQTYRFSAPAFPQEYFDEIKKYNEDGTSTTIVNVFPKCNFISQTKLPPRHKKTEKELSNVISEDIINELNAENGDRLFQKYLKKFQDQGNIAEKIPQARIELCNLASGIKESRKKLQALEAVFTILKNDDYSHESSSRLVELAVQILNLMTLSVVEKMETNIVIKLSEIVQVLAETLDIHSGKRHFIGISEVTKGNLLTAAARMSELNRIENKEIEFNLACAEQLLHRLKSEKQELFVLSKHVCDLILAAGAIYQEDCFEGFQRLESALKITNAHMPNHPWDWYNSLIVLKYLTYEVSEKGVRYQNKLRALNTQDTKTTDRVIIKIDPIFYERSISAKEKAEKKIRKLRIKLDPSAKKHPDSKMIRILTLIKKCHKSLSSDWKFAWASAKILYELVLTGATPEIKMQALMGITLEKQGKHEIKRKYLPGLAYFVGCTDLRSEYEIWGQLKHLATPRKVPINNLIRMASLEYLVNLLNKGDKVIVDQVKAILNMRMHREEDLTLLEMVKHIKAQIDGPLPKTIETGLPNLLLRDT